MKIGDKVKCVYALNSESLEYERDYEVVSINQYDNIQVRQLTRAKATLAHFYKPERFELMNAENKIIDLGKTYKTREGCPVNLFCLSSSREYPVIGEYLNEHGDWENASWSLEGIFYSNAVFSMQVGHLKSSLDLIEVAEEFELEGQSFKAVIYTDGSVYMECKGSSPNSLAIEKSEMAELVKAWRGF